MGGITPAWGHLGVHRRFPLLVSVPIGNATKHDVDALRLGSCLPITTQP